MRDLVLLDRHSGSEGPDTCTAVSGMESHPVLAGIPSSFSFYTACDLGLAHTFATVPATVLMTDRYGSDAAVVRQFGAGRTPRAAPSPSISGSMPSFSHRAS